MTLVPCPECRGSVSDKAYACPACGYPMKSRPAGSNVPGVLGNVAGTYISAQALVSIIVGSVMFLAFAGIMIAAIMK